MSLARNGIAKFQCFILATAEQRRSTHKAAIINNVYSRHATNFEYNSSMFIVTLAVVRQKRHGESRRPLHDKWEVIWSVNGANE